MKTLLTVILLLSLVGCDPDEDFKPPYPEDQPGCMYSNKIGVEPRVFLQCLSYKQFLDRDNRNLDHTWVSAESCDQCPQ